MNERSNLKQDILAEAGDEPIEAIVIGGNPRDWRMGRVLGWEAAAPMLDYEYDAGWGGSDGRHAFVAWTATRVLFADNNDGKTTIVSLPRNPTPHMPVLYRRSRAKVVEVGDDG